MLFLLLLKVSESVSEPAAGLVVSLLGIAVMLELSRPVDIVLYWLGLCRLVIFGGDIDRSAYETELATVLSLQELLKTMASATTHGIWVNFASCFFRVAEGGGGLQLLLTGFLFFLAHV